MRMDRGRTSAAFALAAGAFLFAAAVHPQVTALPAMHMTTQERLETESWWPTMSTAPLRAYSGSEACAGCHLEQSSSSRTGMQNAAVRAIEADFLPSGRSTTFHAGTLTYSLSGKTGGLELSDVSGGRRATQAMDWSFGAGELARTFLYKADDRWFQSEVSYYTRLSALDITTGFGASTSTSPAAALGNVLSPAEARTCFTCHTVHAVTSAGLDPVHAEAGIGCEACHGPGRQHIDAMKARAGGRYDQVDAAGIFHPGKLSPADSIDFCGSCHRSFADASLATGPQADRAVVRFQPYRLEESKCWLKTQDERLTCVACHDPHKPLNRDLGSYDRNCLQCHAGATRDTGATRTAAVCPKAQRDCVTCHMPKVELPSMHGAFTDHFIRVAKAGEPLPR